MLSGPWDPSDPVETRVVLAKEGAVGRDMETAGNLEECDGGTLAIKRQKLQGPGKPGPSS